MIQQKLLRNNKILLLLVLFLIVLVGGCKHINENLIVPVSESTKLETDTIASSILDHKIFNNSSLTIQEISAAFSKDDIATGYTQIVKSYKCFIALQSCEFQPSSFSYSSTIPENNLTIGTQKFILSNIYNKLKKDKRKFRPEIVKIFGIKTTGSENYIAVFAKDFSYNNARLNELLFLFQIKQQEVKQSYFLDDTYFVSEKVFGDYNKDGKIDYLTMTKNLDTVYCLQPEEDRIMQLKDHFLKIDALDGIGQVFRINFSQSNWWK